MVDGAGGLDRVAANERRFLTLTRSRRGDSPLQLDCECASPRCDRRVTMMLDEYRPVHTSAARYVVCPRDEHVDATVDRVVDRHASHWVVERASTLEGRAFSGSPEHAATPEPTALATAAPSHDGPRHAGAPPLNAAPGGTA